MASVSSLPGRILVTGASGLIGSAVRARLVAAGAEVLTISSRNSEIPDAIVLDLAQAEPPLLDRLLIIKPDAIVHLAAVVPNPSLNSNLDLDADKTRAIDKLIMGFAKQWDVPLIYASGCSLYDAADASWKDETFPVGANHPYLAAKLEGEILATEGSAVVLRIASPYGRNMKPSLVLPRFLGRAMRGETIDVWGTGSREQDFVAVEDIASAVEAALVRYRPGIYNVASGTPVTMLHLAELVVNVAGKGSVRVGGHIDAQDGQTARYLIAKSKSELNWTPAARLNERLQAGLFV